MWSKDKQKEYKKLGSKGKKQNKVIMTKNKLTLEHLESLQPKLQEFDMFAKSDRTRMATNIINDYDDNFDSIREVGVQNPYDSIMRRFKTDSSKPGIINLTINQKQNLMRCRDNGEGCPNVTDVVQAWVSTKDSGDERGAKGVGLSSTLLQSDYVKVETIYQDSNGKYFYEYFIMEDVYSKIQSGEKLMIDSGKEEVESQETYFDITISGEQLNFNSCNKLGKVDSWKYDTPEKLAWMLRYLGGVGDTKSLFDDKYKLDIQYNLNFIDGDGVEHLNYDVPFIPWTPAEELPEKDVMYINNTDMMEHKKLTPKARKSKYRNKLIIQKVNKDGLSYLVTMGNRDILMKCFQPYTTDGDDNTYIIDTEAYGGFHISSNGMIHTAKEPVKKGSRKIGGRAFSWTNNTFIIVEGNIELKFGRKDVSGNWKQKYTGGINNGVRLCGNTYDIGQKMYDTYCESLDLQKTPDSSVIPAPSADMTRDEFILHENSPNRLLPQDEQDVISQASILFMREDFRINDKPIYEIVKHSSEIYDAYIKTRVHKKDLGSRHIDDITRYNLSNQVIDEIWNYDCWMDYKVNFRSLLRDFESGVKSIGQMPLAITAFSPSKITKKDKELWEIDKLGSDKFDERVYNRFPGANWIIQEHSSGNCCYVIVLEDHKIN
tara:strand:- start:103 stop:2076 length:1974 start_codon:yes stop_codon:yes gene_type:complete